MAVRPQLAVQGTLYPDVIESCPPPGSGQKHSHTIKSHHNVGGLPKDLDFTLIEPLRELFKVPSASSRDCQLNVAIFVAEVSLKLHERLCSAASGILRGSASVELLVLPCSKDSVVLSVLRLHGAQSVGLSQHYLRQPGSCVCQHETGYM